MCTQLNDNKDYCFDSFDAETSKTNQWISVELSQQMVDGVYKYRVHINGVKVHEAINDNPRMFYNVEVYAGSPFHNAQPGYIRNLIVRGGFP